MLVSLIGLPGVGKSTVGRRLALQTGVVFHDCDALLEARLGATIREVFETSGEPRFRDAEAELLSELTQGGDAVLATGGGAILREQNRRLLRDRTRCVYLSARHEDLWHRLRHDVKRPLMQVADPEQRLRELSLLREPLYRETAAVTIEMRKTSAKFVAAEIVAWLQATRLDAETAKP